MYSIKQDMNLRLSETTDLLNLISSIESGHVTSSTKINTPVLRATVILSLYNIVEATITQALTRLHEEINSSKVNYNNLNKNLKDLALVYFYKHKAKKANIHDSLDVLHHTVDLLRGKGFFSVDYKDMTESYQLYSGNLDAKIIRKVMGKYGITISETYGSKLQAIKNGRNALAHGNKSFEEFGRDILLPSLRIYYTDVENFLAEVVKESGSFIDDKKYRLKKPAAKAKKRR
ncbi:MAE_28990/MAE_18760 family HEPN-like nuclease [Pseudomonas viridiflava]|uniref:MAE_28990/MAE_18760 family HEPN-like nuclease n=1 Tax=Pseudomonas viridiflava TaxID=33069 RepID=UPI002EA18429|nr:MAE_28990/MAE_18760 family HEPN-like nuclease [Pseudomonas viridiflava]